MKARYQHAGVILLRATTSPGDLDVPADLDVDSPGAIERAGRAWLAMAWARDDVREALSAASPVLAARIGQLLDAGAGTAPAEERDLRRAITSTIWYILRWQRRATPFGLFAGIMPTTIGPAEARIGTRHRAVARADADWAAVLAGQLEHDPDLRRRLTVVADNACVIRDGRLIVTRRADPGSRTPGPMRESSIRCTRPVQAALDLAAAPVQLTMLAGELAARFPAVAPGRIDALLSTLTGEGFLITSLRPPMTATDPLAHLIGALRAAGAARLPRLTPLLHDLEDLSRQLQAHDACASPRQAATIRARAADRMRALAPAAGYPLAIDVRLGGQVSIPRQVLDEAAAAADVLLKLTTRPFGSAAWLDYHALFRERYGPGALVPVRDLVADSGLGYPDGYLGAPPGRPAWRVLTDRDAALLALIQQATLTGADEICLTEDTIRALTTGDHADLIRPQRIELGVILRARSAAAISAGDFELQVTAAPRVPTSMAGRFAGLLTDGERAMLAATYTTAGTEPGTVAVQLSFPPRMRHNENVVRTMGLLPDVLPLSEHPGQAEVICLGDLAVTADSAQMYLVQASTGRRVVPRIPHALDLAIQTPPLARFLAEVADARTAVFGPFDYGAARALPYVPRIRYQRTIFAPARWILTSANLASASGDGSSSASDPDAELAAWRQRWRVPARVVLCDGELRLPLDLGQPLDRALLHARLHQARRIELHEDGPPGGDGWIGRPAEILIPMTMASPAPRPLPVTAAPGAVLRPGAGTMVCAKLAGNPARFDDIVSIHLPCLAQRLDGLAERWWMRRHRDLIHPESGQHLAVFLRLTDPAGFARAAAELAAFASDLTARGLPSQLTLAPYAEHPGRYGHGDALEAAEQLFAADTLAAIAQITMARSAQIPGQALAAASMTRIAASFAPDPVAGYQSLTACLDQGSGPLDRALREHACHLADPSQDHQAVRDLPGGDAVTAAWTQRDAVLAAYHQALARQRDPTAVLRTLLHEHHMRALGIDPQLEMQTGRLARAAAQRRLALGRLALAGRS